MPVHGSGAEVIKPNFNPEEEAILREKDLLDDKGKLSGDICRLRRVAINNVLYEFLSRDGERSVNNLRLDLTKKGAPNGVGTHFAGEFQDEISPDELREIMGDIKSVQDFINRSESVRRELTKKYRK